MVLVLVLIVFIAVGPVWLWARRVEKRVGPPSDRPGHEEERFHFKYGAEPPGSDVGGGMPGSGGIQL